jgi:carboxylesterase type B
MVWIHGGAFSLGQALEYLPNRYMEHDIVLVAIQYRLGPLGENTIYFSTPFGSFL